MSQARLFIFLMTEAQYMSAEGGTLVFRLSNFCINRAIPIKRNLTYPVSYCASLISFTWHKIHSQGSSNISHVWKAQGWCNAINYNSFLTLRVHTVQFFFTYSSHPPHPQLWRKTSTIDKKKMPWLNKM